MDPMARKMGLWGLERRATYNRAVVIERVRYRGLEVEYPIDQISNRVGHPRHRQCGYKLSKL